MVVVGKISLFYQEWNLISQICRASWLKLREFINSSFNTVHSTSVGDTLGTEKQVETYRENAGTVLLNIWACVSVSDVGMCSFF
jgi:hypothetical protein